MIFGEAAYFLLQMQAPTWLDKVSHRDHMALPPLTFHQDLCIDGGVTKWWTDSFQFSTSPYKMPGMPEIKDVPQSSTIIMIFLFIVYHENGSFPQPCVEILPPRLYVVLHMFREQSRLHRRDKAPVMKCMLCPMGKELSDKTQLQKDKRGQEHMRDWVISQ